MTELFDVAAGVWWRFDRYEIHDNRIGPAPGAKLEMYDPWAIYREARVPPYRSLLALLDEIGFQPKGQHNLYRLTQESEAKVLSWCESYGLLGVLLHRAQAIILAPRLEPSLLEQLASGAAQDGDVPLMPTQHRYFRTNEGWRDWAQNTLGKGGYRVVGEPELEGTLVAPQDIPPAWSSPHVVLQKLERNELEEEPLGKTLGPFFPTVTPEDRETFSYPRPTSEDFWKLYAEPLHEFYVGANTLLRAIQGLARINPKSTASEEDERSLWRGIPLLHALLAPVSPTIRPLNDGSFEQRWVAQSLLASYAMMVLQDLAENKRPRSCKVCKKLFLSADSRALYCSRKCRHTEQKRRWRAKEKEKGHGETRSE